MNLELKPGKKNLQKNINNLFCISKKDKIPFKILISRGKTFNHFWGYVEQALLAFHQV